MRTGSRTRLHVFLFTAVLACAAPATRAQSSAPFDAALFRVLSWRNVGPSTASFARIVADAAVPYRVCGASPEAPPVCVSSRLGTEAAPGSVLPAFLKTGGALAVDPLDADVVYAGLLSRYDRRTGQAQDVTPLLPAGDRASTFPPVLFPATDARTVFLATSALWKTSNAGQNWTRLAPGPAHIWPDSPIAPSPPHAITAMAISPLDARVMWLALSDGTIQITRDAAATWADITPAQLPARTIVSSIEPSHFDPASAYLSLDGNAPRGPSAPRLMRTRDSGASWTEISAGLSSSGVHVVREDPFRRGLLFAGLDDTVQFSLDDGERWQPLRLNLPAAPVRDLVIKESDVIVAVDGRGLWMLDDMTPLRQITPDIAQAPAFLFRPPLTYRAAWVTPENAPGGATITYLLGPAPRGRVTLEIIETVTGDVIRRFTSDPARAASDLPLPDSPGLHRVTWDLRYAPPAAPGASTATTERRGAWVLPGGYQVRLTAGGPPIRQAITVRLDPRVRTPAADLALLLRLSRQVDAALRQLEAARSSARLPATDARLVELRETMSALLTIFDRLQQSDNRPTAALEGTAASAIERAAAAMAAVQ